MASTEKPSDIIQKARRKLTEALLRIEPGLILDAVDSHLLLTQGEYFSLSRVKDPHELLQNLIDTVLRKGESAHELFLDCLENLRHAFPSLRPLAEYLGNDAVDLRHETEIQSTAVLLMSGAEKSDVAMSPAGDHEVESLDPSVSSEAGQGVEKPDAATVPSGTGSKAENPDVVLSSTQGNGVKNQDATEDGNGVEDPGVAAVCSEKGFSSLKQNVEVQQEVEQEKKCPTKVSFLATEPSSLREGVATLQSTTNIPSSARAGDIPCSGEEGLGGESSSKTATEGSLDSGTRSAKELIHKGQNHLIEILQKNSEVVLDWLLSKSVITKEEYQSLERAEEDSKKAVWKLLVWVQEKEEATCRHFLECLEMACPGATLYLRCSLYATEPSSLAEGVTELQSKLPGSMPTGDMPCSAETKEERWGEASSKTATEGPMDLELIPKEDSKNKSPGMMGKMKAKAEEAFSPVMKDLDPEQSAADLRHETEIQSTAVLLLSGAEKSDVAMSPAGGDEVESLAHSVSSEAGQGVEKPDAATVPSGTGSKAENPDVVLSSTQGNGVKNQDATEDGNGVEEPGVAAVCSEKGFSSLKKNAEVQQEVEQEKKCSTKATKQSPLSKKENSAKLLHRTNTPGSTPAERSCSAEMEQNLKGDIAPQGALDKLMIPANEMIRKGRKQLIEILEKDLDLVLDELFSESVITEEEYEDFNKIEEDSKKSRKLLLLIGKKGPMACCQFLKHLEITCPGSSQVLQRSVHCCSSPEQKAEVQQAKVQQEEKHPAKEALASLQSTGNISESKPVDNMSFSRETETETKKDSSPKISMKGLMDSEPISSLEEMKEDSKNKSQGWMGMMAMAGNAYSSVVNYFNPEQKRKMGQILEKLKLSKSKKFSLQEVLEISEENLKECIPLKLGDLPQHFLRKVLALNVTARSTSLGPKHKHNNKKLRKWEEEKKIVGSTSFSEEREKSSTMNPLDVLCAVLFSSDNFLQQQILLKMSMCQFALPLLLPPLETSDCTLMLWAMRDIVKRWRPQSMADSRSFREESLVLMSMPTISFVRMGKSSFSKSKFVNQFLSSSQQYHDFFVHRDMKGGNIPREIANGLVEVSWYLPGEQNSTSVLSEAVALANLHGDFESHLVQFKFLIQVSSAVFIFAEHIGEREYSVLSSLTEPSTQYYFIILKCDGSEFKETLYFLDKLSSVLKFNNSHILRKCATINEAEFVEDLQYMIENIIIMTQCKKMSVQNMAVVARELKIQVDEDCKECQKAIEWAGEITQDIKDVAVYKRKNLKLQSDLGKNVAKVEKELCRMKRHGDMPPEIYRSKLKGQLVKCREQQYECNLTSSFQSFINGIKHSEPTKKRYFLKWIKFNLDNIGRRNKLQADNKEFSLGVEHFMRELGQYYEAEHSVNNNSKTRRSKPHFVNFPSIAADLMLEGFPLELIDGDASNVPLQWITDVLSKVHEKLKRKSRMFVITVLGVQSTGKSTLLNTMFGLQFAVSSGRCTRGAFMTLLKVQKNMIKELGVEFILVIDTEGLKAPELAKLEDSYQHDNELATLVVGLSDVTIVNMAMENATEMKDILQIVTHAFLRMEKIGGKPNCQFVHQNVSDISAHDQNRKDRKLLLEQLDELTKSAAKMEKLNRDIKFSDIMDYTSEMHNWYIPSLWHGVPPMASVNVAYSEKVFQLKQCLFEIIRNRSRERTAKDIPQFIEWVKSLWNAVKHENFIFSFRNSLIAEAYTNLSMKYSEWDWAFRREMHLWVSEQDNMIQNTSPDELDGQNFQDKLDRKLVYEKQQILENLSKYFESGASNLHLVEKYREDFVRSANSLHREVHSTSSNKIQDTIRIRKDQKMIAALRDEYLKTIEGKVDGLLELCRQRDHKLEDEELKKEFDRMWGETLMEISPIRLQQLNIESEIEQYLTKELTSRGRLVNQKLETDGLLSYRINNFKMKDVYIHSPGSVKQNFTLDNYLHRVKEQFVDSLIDKCRSYIDEKVGSKGDYDITYCSELLHMINEKLKEGDIQKLYTTPSFEVDLKLHTMGEASYSFQKMHDNFIKENDPRTCLERLKSRYFSTFTDLYLEKDAQQNRAKDFCDQCLHPALVDYVNKILGIEIVGDFLASKQGIGYSTRSFFQFTVLKELLDRKIFEQYVEYLKCYEEFVKNCILRHVVDHVSENEALKNLEKQILTAVQKKVSKTLKNLKDKDLEIWECLDYFCQEMQKDLVISKDSLRGIQFRNMSDPGKFFDYVENFLPDLEKRILSDLEKRILSDVSRIESKLASLPVKPQDAIFKHVFGCGKQCPFCKVPCEAGGSSHEEHFAAIHQPQGLGTYHYISSEKLVSNLCSTVVASNAQFKNSKTKWELHPYKDYRDYYPDWCIQPDPSINASDYWKFVFRKFNHDFAACYGAKPADLPEDWENITEEDALKALRKTYNMK